MMHKLCGLARSITCHFKKEEQSIFRFLLVGVSTFILYYMIFSLLYYAIGIRYIVSISISYLLAITYHFLINRQYTFNCTSSTFISSLLKYFCMCLINYIITISIVEISVRWLLLPPDIGLILSVFTTLLTGYLILRLWVFRNEQK
jgi:putative flippase GtrA